MLGNETRDGARLLLSKMCNKARHLGLTAMVSTLAKTASVDM